MMGAKSRLDPLVLVSIGLVGVILLTLTIIKGAQDRQEAQKSAVSLAQVEQKPSADTGSVAGDLPASQSDLNSVPTPVSVQTPATDCSAAPEAPAPIFQAGTPLSSEGIPAGAVRGEGNILQAVSEGSQFTSVGQSDVQQPGVNVTVLSSGSSGHEYVNVSPTYRPNPSWTITRNGMIGNPPVDPPSARGRAYHQVVVDR